MKPFNMQPQVIWFFGLSGAGKTTLSDAVAKTLRQQGIAVKQLDGDDLRRGLNSNLGFSLEDRLENIRRSAEVAKLFMESGFVTLCSFITPTEETRRVMQQVLHNTPLTQVYVQASLDTCRRRDPKGFYLKVDRGEIKNFTGIDSLFEAPRHPDVTIVTDHSSVDVCVHELLDAINSSQPCDSMPRAVQ